MTTGIVAGEPAGVEDLSFPTEEDQQNYLALNALQMDVNAMVRHIHTEARPLVLGQIIKEADLMRAAAKAVQLGVSIQNNAAIVAMEARARVGELYAGLQDGEGNRFSRSSTAVDDLDTPKQEFASEVGMSRYEISRYVQLAKAPAAERSDLYQAAADGSTGEITWKGVYRAVRTRLGLGENIRSRMTESNEWYTPAKYIEAALATMGSIDLDPASHPAANETVGAARFYTLADDGLALPWSGNIFLNPPYHDYNQKAQVPIWGKKLIDEIGLGNVRQALVLVSSLHTRHSEIQWLMAESASCFTDHYIKFISSNATSDKAAAANSVFIYWGERVTEFSHNFVDFGVILRGLSAEVKI